MLWHDVIEALLTVLVPVSFATLAYAATTLVRRTWTTLHPRRRSQGR